MVQHIRHCRLFLLTKSLKYATITASNRKGKEMNQRIEIYNNKGEIQVNLINGDTQTHVGFGANLELALEDLIENIRLTNTQ